MNELKKDIEIELMKRPSLRKDPSSADLTFVLKVFFLFFGPFALLGIFLYHTVDLPWYVAPVASLICTCALLLFFKFIFKTFDYFTGHVATRGIREQLSGEIERIRYLKRCEQYNEALKMAESVLQKDPDFPEVLYLKGQILYEGFGLKNQSKEVLLRVMMLVPKEDPLHDWAMNYRKQI